jgi:hypothetical protein
VNYADFTKKLVLPPDFEAPRTLTYEDLGAEALDRSHLGDERGYYTKLYVALRHWLAEEFPFDAVHYSNSEIPSAS